MVWYHVWYLSGFLSLHLVVFQQWLPVVMVAFCHPTGMLCHRYHINNAVQLCSPFRCQRVDHQKSADSLLTSRVTGSTALTVLSQHSRFTPIL